MNVAPSRLMYWIPPEHVREAFDDVVGVVPSEWKCPCGCGNVVYYARDARALWIVISATAEPGGINFFGAELLEELHDWLTRARNAPGRTAPDADFDDLERTLVAAFAD